MYGSSIPEDGVFDVQMDPMGSNKYLNDLIGSSRVSLNHLAQPVRATKRVSASAFTPIEQTSWEDDIISELPKSDEIVPARSTKRTSQLESELVDRELALGELSAIEKLMASRLQWHEERSRQLQRKQVETSVPNPSSHLNQNNGNFFLSSYGQDQFSGQFQNPFTAPSLPPTRNRISLKLQSKVKDLHRRRRQFEEKKPLASDGQQSAPSLKDRFDDVLADYNGDPSISETSTRLWGSVYDSTTGAPVDETKDSMSKGKSRIAAIHRDSSRLNTGKSLSLPRVLGGSRLVTNNEVAGGRWVDVTEGLLSLYEQVSGINETDRSQTNQLPDIDIGSISMDPFDFVDGPDDEPTQADFYEADPDAVQPTRRSGAALKHVLDVDIRRYSSLYLHSSDPSLRIGSDQLTQSQSAVTEMAQRGTTGIGAEQKNEIALPESSDPRPLPRIPGVLSSYVEAEVEEQLVRAIASEGGYTGVDDVGKEGKEEEDDEQEDDDDDDLDDDDEDESSDSEDEKDKHKSGAKAGKKRGQKAYELAKQKFRRARFQALIKAMNQRRQLCESLAYGLPLITLNYSNDNFYTSEVISETSVARHATLATELTPGAFKPVILSYEEAQQVMCPKLSLIGRPPNPLARFIGVANTQVSTSGNLEAATPKSAQIPKIVTEFNRELQAAAAAPSGFLEGTEVPTVEMIRLSPAFIKRRDELSSESKDQKGGSSHKSHSSSLSDRNSAVDDDAWALDWEDNPSSTAITQTTGVPMSSADTCPAVNKFEVAANQPGEGDDEGMQLPANEALNPSTGANPSSDGTSGNGQPDSSAKADKAGENDSTTTASNWDFVSASSGAILAIEYLEENPCLLPRPGMRSLITTYYRPRAIVKRRGRISAATRAAMAAASASAANAIASGNHNLIPPPLGTVKMLGPKEEQPLLGTLSDGDAVTVISNGLYESCMSRAPQPTLYHDYLLVRPPNAPPGVWYLRRAPPVYTVGQVQPRTVIPAPNTSRASDIYVRWIASYIYRHFKANDVLKTAEIEKQFSLLGLVMEAIGSITESAGSSALDYEAMGAGQLKGRFGAPANLRLVNRESQLQQLTPDSIDAMCPPEDAVVLMAMQIAIHRLRKIGFKSLTFAPPSPELAHVVLSFAHSKVQSLAKGARLILQELLSTPWVWSFNAVERPKALQLMTRPQPIGKFASFSFGLTSAMLQPTTTRRKLVSTTGASVLGRGLTSGRGRGRGGRGGRGRGGAVRGRSKEEDLPLHATSIREVNMRCVGKAQAIQFLIHKNHPAQGLEELSRSKLLELVLKYLDKGTRKSDAAGGQIDTSIVDEYRDKVAKIQRELVTSPLPPPLDSIVGLDPFDPDIDDPSRAIPCANQILKSLVNNASGFGGTLDDPSLMHESRGAGNSLLASMTKSDESAFLASPRGGSGPHGGLLARGGATPALDYSGTSTGRSSRGSTIAEFDVSPRDVYGINGEYGSGEPGDENEYNLDYTGHLPVVVEIKRQMSVNKKNITKPPPSSFADMHAIKHTVVSYRPDGTTQTRITYITDPIAVRALEMDCRDTGMRFPRHQRAMVQEFRKDASHPDGFTAPPTQYDSAFFLNEHDPTATQVGLGAKTQPLADLSQTAVVDTARGGSARSRAAVATAAAAAAAVAAATAGASSSSAALDAEMMGTRKSKRIYDSDSTYKTVGAALFGTDKRAGNRTNTGYGRGRGLANAASDVDPALERLRRLPRGDPKVHLASNLSKMVDCAYSLPKPIMEMFRHPVTNKEAPTYKTIVKNPMDLQTLKARVDSNRYLTVKSFLGDVDLIYANSVLFNSETALITQNAKRVVEAIKGPLQDLEFAQMLSDFERACEIQSKVNDLNQELRTIVGKLMTNEKSLFFRAKPTAKQLPGYYNIIVKPIALQLMQYECERGSYPSTEAFLADLNLIVRNSAQYNGRDSDATKSALAVYKLGEELIFQLPPNIQSIRDSRRDPTALSLGVISSEPISHIDVHGSAGRSKAGIASLFKRPKIASGMPASHAFAGMTQNRDAFTDDDLQALILEEGEGFDESGLNFAQQSDAEEAVTMTAAAVDRVSHTNDPTSVASNDERGNENLMIDAPNTETTSTSEPDASGGFVL